MAYVSVQNCRILIDENKAGEKLKKIKLNFTWNVFKTSTCSARFYDDKSSWKKGVNSLVYSDYIEHVINVINGKYQEDKELDQIDQILFPTLPVSDFETRKVHV